MEKLREIFEATAREVASMLSDDAALYVDLSAHPEQNFVYLCCLMEDETQVFFLHEEDYREKIALIPATIRMMKAEQRARAAEERAAMLEAKLEVLNNQEPMGKPAGECECDVETETKEGVA